MNIAVISAEDEWKNSLRATLKKIKTETPRIMQDSTAGDVSSVDWE